MVLGEKIPLSYLRCDCAGSHSVGRLAWLATPAFSDLQFAWQSRPASGNIVVIGIDAASIEKIGVWPWPRSLYAELLRRLEKADVQDIALDVDFSTPSDAVSDDSFAAALESAGGSVVLPSFQQTRADRTTLHINRPLPQFAKHSWPALSQQSKSRPTA